MESGVTHQVEGAPLEVMQGGAEERKARASLYTKMAKVLAGITRIPKLGYNENFNYNFATESDIVDAVRGLMAEAGLCMFVSMENVERTAMKTSRGNDTTHTAITLQISICDGDTGVCWISSWRGEAQDNQDKGIPKAATSAVKYFLLKTFLISTGNLAEDPDSDWGNEPPAQRRPQRPTQPRKDVPRKGVHAPQPVAAKPTTGGEKSSACPTDFYTLVKREHTGPGKRFQNDADIKAYLENHKTGDGSYNWQAAIAGLSQ
ncbi:MAG: ERF family protein [Anaerolineae bacterium]|nr:ERF family protein [Anaerolineae bacterium]